MKIKRVGFLVITLLLLICVLAGCGATINTEFNITKDFSGQRRIDVEIGDDDLGEVTGGIDALEAVAESELPEEMEFSLAKVDGGYRISFIIEFKNLDEYREKVSAIISSGSNEDLVPETSYENLDTVFKKGIKLDENFSSFDLLQWYFDAVKEANIVTYGDTSDWYERGSTRVIIDEFEYDSDWALSVNEQDSCCLDDISVKTTLNIDGTFTREFKFLADDSTVEKLAERGCDLSSYICDLAAEEDTYVENTEDTVNEYVITIKAADAVQLIERTNKILQTENKFSLELELDEENLGNANIKLEEKLDGSFYLDYDNGSPLLSTIELYDNCSLKEAGENDVTIEGDVLKYYPSSASDYSFDLDWKISFSSVEIVPNISNKDKATIDFVFTSEATLQEDLKKGAVEALKARCGEDASFEENGDVVTVSFSGTLDELNDQINSFIESGDSQRTEGKSYFEITLSEAKTTTNFKNSFAGNIRYDLYPIVGNTRILFNDVDGTFTDYYYQGNFVTDGEGNRTAPSSGEISFAVVEFSLLVIIPFIISCVLLISGIVIILVKRKAIAGIISTARAKKKADMEMKSKEDAATNAGSGRSSVAVATETDESAEIGQEEELL